MTIESLLQNFRVHGNDKYLTHLPTYLYNGARYRELMGLEYGSTSENSTSQYPNFFTFIVLLSAYVSDARIICEQIMQYIQNRGFTGYDEQGNSSFSTSIFEMLATNFGITLSVPEQDETTSQGLTQQYFYDALTSLEVKRQSFSTINDMMEGFASTSNLVNGIRLLKDWSIIAPEKGRKNMTITLDLVTEHFIDSAVLADVIVPRVTGVHFEATAAPLDLPVFAFDTYVPSEIAGTWVGYYDDQEKMFIVSSVTVMCDDEAFTIDTDDDGAKLHIEDTGDSYKLTLGTEWTLTYDRLSNTFTAAKNSDTSNDFNLTQVVSDVDLQGWDKGYWVTEYVTQN